LESGRNSIVAEGGLDAFVAAIAELVESAEHRAVLAAGAIESRESLTVASMANSFHRAVCQTLCLDAAE
jgi:hypothetical protein